MSIWYTFRDGILCKKHKLNRRVKSNQSRCNCVATMRELCVFWRSLLYCKLRFFVTRTMNNKEKTALFIGNRDCYQVKEAVIEQAIISTLENGIEIFLNGGQGYFDQICASVVHRLKKHYPHIKSILVIPYRDFKVFNDSLFDEIVYPFESHTFSYYTYKGNILKRNRLIVDWSSVAICYVYRSGGAKKTLDYAKRQNLKIIDLFMLS